MTTPTEAERLRRQHPHRPRLGDDEWVDGITIEVVPRFKQSGLSGDEWRTSARVTIWRKGIPMRVRSFHRVEEAVAHLGSIVGYAPADYSLGLEHQGEKEAGSDSRLTDHLCAQPGCDQPFTVELEKVRQACREGHVEDIAYGPYVVRFCDRHKVRGDASLDDADANYRPWEAAS